MKWEPFSVDDLEFLTVQDRHAPALDAVLQAPKEKVISLTENEWAYTLWSPYGVPVACVGMMAGDLAWAFLNPDMRKHMLKVTRFIEDYLSRYPRDMVAHIDEDHAEAVRWAKLLKFNRVRPGEWIRKCASSTILGQ